ncbi:hypothetical protein Tco_0847467 [Tanacetum coccineum]
MTSSSLPPPSLLPYSSHKRSRSPSPPPPPAPPPPPPPLPEHIKSVRDVIETLRTSLASAMQETMTLCVRVRLLEQHNMVTRDSLWFARDEAHTQRTDMTEQDSEASRARAAVAKHQAETL